MRRSASLVALAATALVAIAVPKCPACLAAQLALLGVGFGAASAILPLLWPFPLALLALVLGVLTRRSPRTDGGRDRLRVRLRPNTTRAPGARGAGRRFEAGHLMARRGLSEAGGGRISGVIRRPNRQLALLGIAGLGALGSSEAHAVRIAGSATGVIAEQAETDAAGEQVFGLDGSGLLGQPFRIDFAYETNLAPPDSDPAAARGEHASSDPALDWLDLSITVNGHTEVLPGDYRRVFVLDSLPSEPIPEDWLQLGIESYVDLPGGTGQEREFLDFLVVMPADTFSSAELPVGFASDQITRVFNSAAFRINDFEFDPDTNELLSSRWVSFNLDIQEISASAVPEPGTGALLAPGVIGLALARRRRSARQR